MSTKSPWSTFIVNLVFIRKPMTDGNCRNVKRTCLQPVYVARLPYISNFFFTTCPCKKKAIHTHTHNWQLRESGITYTYIYDSDFTAEFGWK